MSDQDDFTNDESDDSPEESEETFDSGSNDAPPKDEGSDGADEKRVNDLMSKWQSEQAKANRLQKELDSLKAKAPSASKAKNARADSGADEFVQFARESARTQLFNSDPRLAAYGLSASSIAGDSLDEMKASVKAQLDLISAIETKTRNQILAEHGLEPSVASGEASGEVPNFLSMSDKDFEAFLNQRDSKLR